MRYLFLVCLMCALFTGACVPSDKRHLIKFDVPKARTEVRYGGWMCLSGMTEFGLEHMGFAVKCYQLAPIIERDKR